MENTGELHISGRLKNGFNEPDWLSGKIGGKLAGKLMTNDADGDGLADLPLQQSDMLKPLYMDIVQNGLDHAYRTYGEDNPWVTPSNRVRTPEKTEKSRDVIIIGAGLSGLAAAYELREAGHRVHIVEMQERVGGRVKTIGEKEGFAKGLCIEAGAMRLPNEPGQKEKTHYLTDYYAKTKFDLPLVDFRNSDDNAFVKFYDMDPMTHACWNGSDRGYTNFCNTWPGWDSKVSSNPDIKNIGDYYSATVKIVTDQLRGRLAGQHTQNQKAAIWHKWIDNWSRFPLNGYLRSTALEVRSKLDEDYRANVDFNTLATLIPWPEEAMTAYTVYNYTEQLDQSLVQFLQEELGEWWSDNMHQIDGGMSRLPEKFHDLLKDDITFNVTVNEIQYTATETEKKVIVSGYHSISGQPCSFEGYAVIVTTPLHIIRQMMITNITAATLR